MPATDASSETLAERLGPIDPPVVPSHPDVARWRAPVPADLDALMEFFAAVAAGDHPHWVEQRDEVAEVFSLPHVDPARDAMVAFGPDGRVMAYGSAVCPPGRETVVRAIIVGAVRPDARGRGIGRRLLAWQSARAREQLAASDARLPGWIMSFATDGVADAAALLEHAGLRRVRHFSSLERDLRAPVPDAQVAEGIRVVPWSDHWAESARLARNEAFADHWGSQSTSPESWAAMHEAGSFAPDLSFLALAADGPDERVVSFVIALREPPTPAAPDGPSAYVRLVGTLRAHRGRGLARVLLVRHLDAAERAGIGRSTLDVDAANPTGAVGLYTALGYEVTSGHSGYVLEV
ncbi:GNAT family N-acetyltransferase [Agromyces sp. SYSU T0242]|uniref:GNAT family N-acetyltransferase n=1 Tax=Agromyces litoreus TaxID=3158561 RepID=UPI0033977C16